MPELVVRPSLKFVWVGYLVAALFVVGVAAGSAQVAPDAGLWPVAAAALAFLIPAQKHIRRLSTVATLEGDKLRYESGLLSRSTRTLPLGKIQDIRVDQTLGQRVVGLGSVTIVTAGDSGGIVMEGIDSPRRIADAILDAAGRQPGNKP
ncbi:MAG: PH domain-containing protein [Bryobacteraceae bacterium]